MRQDAGRAGAESDRVIPTAEIDKLTETVAAALELVTKGRIGEGYALLSAGRVRAERLARSGLPWAEALARRWRLACDNFVDSFGLRIG